MLFLQITQMVLPVLAAMAIGFFCRRSGLLNAQGHAALKTVIGNITLPVVLFNAFLTAEYNAGLLLGFAVVFTACGIACAAGYALRPLVAPHGRFLPFLMHCYSRSKSQTISLICCGRKKSAARSFSVHRVRRNSNKSITSYLRT